MSHCRSNTAGPFIKCHGFIAWSVKSIKTVLPVSFIFTFVILFVCFCLWLYFIPPLPSLLESHFKQNKCHYIVNTSGFFWRKKNTNKTLKNQINEQKYKLKPLCCVLFFFLFFLLFCLFFSTRSFSLFMIAAVFRELFHPWERMILMVTKWLCLQKCLSCLQE